MGPQQVEDWKKTRAGGAVRFIPRMGAAWGLPMFVTMTFFVGPRPGALGIALSAVVWLVAGALFGTSMWFYNEWQFRRAARPGA